MVSSSRHKETLDITQASSLSGMTTSTTTPSITHTSLPPATTTSTTTPTDMQCRAATTRCLPTACGIYLQDWIDICRYIRASIGICNNIKPFVENPIFASPNVFSMDNQDKQAMHPYSRNANTSDNTLPPAITPTMHQLLIQPQKLKLVQSPGGPGWIVRRPRHLMPQFIRRSYS
ncbi:hypothetical protein ACOSP7_009536 [Xanthoceras sorbifolium]